MKTYAAIKAEIAKLEKRAETLKKTEVAGVVARIKEAIAAYGLTVQDLFGGSSRARASRVNDTKRKVARQSSVGVAKYRDPATGKTWTGHGRPPAWVSAASNRDSLLIAAPAASAVGGKGAAKKPGAGKRANQGRKVAGARKAAKQPVKAAAVQIESGAASE